MPYPNEHAARIRNPGDFQSNTFRSKAVGDGIRIIMGRLKGQTAMTEQAYRFKTDKFSAADAKKWLKDHDVKYAMFEPAEPAAKAAEDEGDPVPDADVIIPEQVSDGIQSFRVHIGLIRKQKWNGKDHWVVPTVMMPQGVHNRILYKGDELARYVDTWNGRPVIVLHSRNQLGTYCSANQPEFFEKQKIGTLFNARFDSGRLAADAFIDPDDAKRVSPTVHVRLASGQPLEVSLCAFEKDEVKPGVEAGETYQYIAHEVRGDHLAVLPEGGASVPWSRGAGMPRVHEKEPDQTEDGSFIEPDEPEVVVHGEISNLGISLGKLSRGVSDAVRAAYNTQDQDETGNPVLPRIRTYITDVFPKYVVFELDTYGGIGTDPGMKYYMQTYEVQKDGSVKLTGEREEVVKEVKYTPVSKITKSPVVFSRTVQSHHKTGETKMDESAKKQKVQAIIDAGGIQITAHEQSVLESLPDEVLEKVIPARKQEVVTHQQQPAKETTFEDLLKAAPQKVREAVEHGIRLHMERRAQLVATVKAHKKNVLTDDQLNAFSTEQLESIAALAAGEPEQPSMLGMLSGRPVAHAAAGTAPKVEPLGLPVFGAGAKK